jgi:hypothetical protein
LVLAVWLLSCIGCGSKGPSYAESVQTLNAEEASLERLKAEEAAQQAKYDKRIAEVNASQTEYDKTFVFQNETADQSRERVKGQSEGSKKFNTARMELAGWRDDDSKALQEKVDKQQQRVDAARRARDAIQPGH